VANVFSSGKYILDAIDQCFSTLTHIDVSGCFQITDQHLISVLEKCPKLTHINIKNCRKITDTFLRQLATASHLHLLEVDIGGNFNITDEGVKFFVKQYRGINHIEDFTISGLTISDDTILQILRTCSNLKHFRIAYLDLKESTLIQIFQVLGRQLESLDLSWPSSTPNARNVQPSGPFLVEHLPSLCPMLTTLDLSANRNITLAHIQEIIERKLSYQVKIIIIILIIVFSYLFLLQSMSLASSGKPLETLTVKFIGTTKATLETNLKYQNIKIMY
jgi:hypothetical protein